MPQKECAIGCHGLAWCFGRNVWRNLAIRNRWIPGRFALGRAPTGLVWGALNGFGKCLFV